MDRELFRACHCNKTLRVFEHHLLQSRHQFYGLRQEGKLGASKAQSIWEEKTKAMNDAKLSPLVEGDLVRPTRWKSYVSFIYNEPDVRKRTLVEANDEDVAIILCFQGFWSKVFIRGSVKYIVTAHWLGLK